MSVSQANSTIEFKIYDWNRIQSNELLGVAKLNLELYKIGVFEVASLNLDTQGQLNVMFLLEPFRTPLVKPIRERLSQMRVQLENSAYYPGSTIRGVAVYSTVKPVIIHGLSLTLEGHSWTHWSTGSKHKTFYYSYRSYFNERIPLLGAVGKESKNTRVDLVPGVYLFPFEYVLPMDLPPTLELFQHHISYRALLFSEIKGKANKSSELTFCILSNHKLMRSELIGAEVTGMKGGAFGKDEPVKLHIHGPATAFVGERYKIHCKIDNTMGKKAIESITILLRQLEYVYGRVSGSGRMVRHFPVKHLYKEWKLVSLPGLPIGVGASWEGDIDLDIPDSLSTSIHSTMCPNIQNRYYFKLKVTTAGNVFSKASGSSRFNFLMASHNAAFEGLPCPSEPEGPVNTVWIAPAPANVFSMLPPAVSSDGSIVPCGRPIGYVGQMAGAHVAVSLPDPKPQLGSPNCVITSADWKPGTSPQWVGEEGLSPEESFEPGNYEPLPPNPQ